MSGHSLSQSAQVSRAAEQLIRSHGSRAAGVAIKRAVYLHLCGKDAEANTWRKISEFVRRIEAGKANDKPTGNVSAASDLANATPS